MENRPCLSEWTALKRHHDQQVNVRIGIWFPIRPGTEEDDFFRLKFSCDDCTEACDLPTPLPRSGVARLRYPDLCGLAFHSSKYSTLSCSRRTTRPAMQHKALKKPQLKPCRVARDFRCARWYAILRRDRP